MTPASAAGVPGRKRATGVSGLTAPSVHARRKSGTVHMALVRLAKSKGVSRATPLGRAAKDGLALVPNRRLGRGEATLTDAFIEQCLERVRHAVAVSSGVRLPASASRANPRPQAEGHVDGSMADGEAHRAGEPCLLGERAQYVSDGDGGAGAFAVGEATHGKAGPAGENAGISQVRPQTVETVGLLAVVFDQEDGPSRVRKPRGAEECRHDGQVSSEEWPLRNASHERRGPSERWRKAAFEKLKEPVEDELRLVRGLRHHRSVNTRARVGLQRRVEDGDVGAADEQFRRLSADVQEREQPPGSAPAPGTEDSANVRVIQSLNQRPATYCVRPCQVALSVEDVLVEHGGVALRKARNAEPQEFRVDGTRGTHNGDAVSGPEGRGAKHPASEASTGTRRSQGTTNTPRETASRLARRVPGRVHPLAGAIAVRTPPLCLLGGFDFGVCPEKVEHRLWPCREGKVGNVADACHLPVLDADAGRTARVRDVRSLCRRAVASEVQGLAERLGSGAPVGLRPEGQRRLSRAVGAEKAGGATAILDERVRRTVHGENRHWLRGVAVGWVDRPREADDGRYSVAPLACHAIGHEGAVGVPDDEDAVRIRAGMP